MTEIHLDEILNYKIKTQRDYLKGGFYLILDVKNNKKYIGKSIDYLARLKQHLHKSNKRTLIDIELKKDVLNFKFYLIHHYSEFNINFFNRKLETKIEHRLIKENASFYPNGFNIAYYEHI